MTRERDQKIREIYQRAHALPAGEQAAYLAGACGDDAGLRAEVEALLKQDRERRVAATLGTNVPGSADGAAVTTPRPPDGAAGAHGVTVPNTPLPLRSDATVPYDRPSSSFVSHGRFTPGTILVNRWRIVAMLGAGGMGEVYRADDLKLQQPVALKFLSRKLQKDPSRLRDLYTEVRMARQVSHPHVNRVYDIEEVDGDHFISMEYVDGENLDSLLRRIGRLPREKAVQMAQHLCAGLAAIHDQGMLHRDLKPGNIMVDGRGHAKISDFGLAALPRDVAGMRGIAGTPGYMAPEVIAGEPPTVQSDLYALGLVLYEMFTGRPAYEGRGVMELLDLQRQSDPPRPSTIIHDMDSDVEHVLLQCLERTASSRPPSARAIGAMLPGGNALRAALAAGETPSPELVAAAGRTSGIPVRVGVMLMGAIVALLVLVIGLSSKSFLLPRLPAGKAPAVLEDRAHDLLRRLGYPDPHDTARGMALSGETLNSLRELSGASFDRAQASVLRFWYRESLDRASPLLPMDRLSGRPSEFDPPPLVPGMVQVAMDPTGRLLEFGAVPPLPDAKPREHPTTAEAGVETPAEAEVNWRPLFEAAGLEIDQFRPTPADFIPPQYATRTYAWHMDREGEPARVVHAASYAGRPVHFAVGVASEAAGGTEAGWAYALAGKLDSLAYAIILTGGAVMAWLNVRSGRGDRRGAFRLAGFMFCVYMAYWVLSSRVYADLSIEMDTLTAGVALSLFVGALVWMYYMAVEPTVRRVWPEIMITWNRVLAGRFKDPLVGRDVLIGVLAGLFAVFVLQVDVLSPRMLGEPLGRPISPTGDLSVLMGALPAFAVLWQVLLISGLLALAMLLFVVLARVALRREWAAAGALWLLQTVLFALLGAHPVLSWLWSALLFGVSVIVLIRVGLLALSAGLFTYHIMLAYPITSDFDAWYSGLGLFGVAAVLAVSAFALRNALRAGPGGTN